MIASKEEIIKAAELGILRSMPDFLAEPLKPGRLKRLFMEVSMIVDAELRFINKQDPDFYKHNKMEITSCLAKFGKVTGWSSNKEDIHVASVVAFCLAFLEVSKSNYTPKLIEKLKDILDYYDRASNLKHSDLWSGTKFKHIWNNVNTVLN